MLFFCADPYNALDIQAGTGSPLQNRNAHKSQEAIPDRKSGSPFVCWHFCIMGIMVLKRSMVHWNCRKEIQFLCL